MMEAIKFSEKININERISAAWDVADILRLQSDYFGKVLISVYNKAIITF